MSDTEGGSPSPPRDDAPEHRISTIDSDPKLDRAYKRLRNNSLAVAAASLAVVPQKLVSLIVYISLGNACDFASARSSGFLTFVGVGLLMCAIQATLLVGHHVLIGAFKDRDSRRLSESGPFPRHEMSFRNPYYRLLFWTQMSLVSFYATLFIVSDALLAGQAGCQSDLQPL